VKRAAVVLLASLASGCAPPEPLTIEARVSCVPEARALRQLCTVTLSDRKTGRPVEGATVTLHADMPSMPLAHSVRPATARPGATPGTYHGVLELEMTGRWVIAVRVSGPVSDQISQVLEVN
jgi:hypothetical protein